MNPLARPRGSSLVVALLLGGVSGAASGQLVRVGTEFEVSQFTGNLFEPAVAMDATGDFVVVWSGVGQDGQSYGVFARRFDPSGNALGVEFQVNTHTPNQQRSPDVATEPDGDFVVVWESALQDGQLFGVFGQRFDSAGTKVGGEFLASSFTLGSQSGPRVAVADDGDFVVVWYSDDQDGSEIGVFGRRFDSAGAPQEGEFQVNGFTAGTQWFPVPAMDSAGNFVVAWDDEDRGEVLGRRFDATGMALGGEFFVNSFTTNTQRSASIAMDPNGDFLVVWQSFGQDGSDNGIFGRRFNALGLSQAAEFQVNDYETGAQTAPDVGMTGAGDFMALWQSAGQDGDSTGVFGLAGTQAAFPVGSELQVNTSTATSQGAPDVAASDDGDFVVAWSSQHLGGIRVFAQRFKVAAGAANIDVDGNGVAQALTDGLLIIRYLFGVRDGALISGAVAGNCTRCTADEIEAFIASVLP